MFSINFFCMLLIIILTIIFITGTINTIYSLLLLICIYIIGAILLFNWDMEYFALLLIIIYAGAITILFIFTLMMLNLKITKKYFNWKLFFFLFILTIITFCWLIDFFGFDPTIYFFNIKTKNINPFLLIDTNNVLQILSQVLYTYYSLAFLIVGFILFIGFIGAIIITIEINKIQKNNLNKILTRNSFLKKTLKEKNNF